MGNKYHIIISVTDTNDPIAYDRGMEYHHTIISTLGGNGDQFRDRERNIKRDLEYRIFNNYTVVIQIHQNLHKFVTNRMHTEQKIQEYHQILPLRNGEKDWSCYCKK